MKHLTPTEISTLVAKAFCLEAIADKNDATGRYKDLPDRPLEGFIIAGINVGSEFALFASNRITGSKRVYDHYLSALKASNKHKSSKYVNFGLLEIMFPVVATRLLCNDRHAVVSTINTVLASAPKSDVKAMLDARKLAWSTSNNLQKQSFEFSLSTDDVQSPADFYEALYRKAKEGTSSLQWVEQYKQDWTILSQMFNGLLNSKKISILDKISETFNSIRAENMEIRIGILADMCAAAIFLYLSYS